MTSHGKSEMARPILPGYQSYSRRQPAINFSEHSILRNLPEASINLILACVALVVLRLRDLVQYVLSPLSLRGGIRGLIASRVWG